MEEEVTPRSWDGSLGVGVVGGEERNLGLFSSQAFLFLFSLIFICTYLCIWQRWGSFLSCGL